LRSLQCLDACVMGGVAGVLQGILREPRRM